MKKIFYIFSALLAVVATGCSSDKDIDMDLHGGKGLEFVHFASPSDSWLVQESDESYIHDVVIASTYTYDEDVTYSVSVGENTTGVEGTDFSIPTKSVTIKAGEHTGKLPVKILYDTTGEGFEIEIVLSVDKELVNPIYGSSATIVIKTDKITMDWDWLAGKWTCQDYSYYHGANDGDPYTVSITKVDETNGILNGLAGGDPLNFTVDFDAKTISFPGYQYITSVAQYSCDLYFVAVNPASDFSVYDPLTTPVVASLSPAGIVIDNYDFLIVGGQYDGETWNGGVKSTLTK